MIPDYYVPSQEVTNYYNFAKKNNFKLEDQNAIKKFVDQKFPDRNRISLKISQLAKPLFAGLLIGTGTFLILSAFTVTLPLAIPLALVAGIVSYIVFAPSKKHIAFEESVFKLQRDNSRTLLTSIINDGLNKQKDILYDVAINPEDIKFETYPIAFQIREEME